MKDLAKPWIGKLQRKSLMNLSCKNADSIMLLKWEITGRKMLVVILYVNLLFSFQQYAMKVIEKLIIITLCLTSQKVALGT